MNKTQEQRRPLSQPLSDRQKISEEQNTPLFRENLDRLREQRRAREAAKTKADDV